MKVVGLNIYPLKSGRAVSRDSVDVKFDGLEGDRRFMLVEPHGRFITQRELPVLAQVEASPIDRGVRLRMGTKEALVHFDPKRRLTVRVWASEVSAAISDDSANETLSAWFGRPVKLARMDGHSERFVGAEWAGAPAPVSFVDSFPILITARGSLADLNETLIRKHQEPVGMDRFRANIVVDCNDAWAEDLWESVEIGGTCLDLVKPCGRCIMTTQDQTTGERIGGNPIQGLVEKRMSADRRVAAVLFGWYAVPRNEGPVTLGNQVRIVRSRAERWPTKAQVST